MLLSPTAKDMIRIALGYPPADQITLNQLEADYPPTYIDYIDNLLSQINAQLQQTTQFTLAQLNTLNVKKMEDLEFFSPMEYKSSIYAGSTDLINKLSQALGLPPNLPTRRLGRCATNPSTVCHYQ